LRCTQESDAEFLRIVEQLDKEGDVLSGVAETDSLDMSLFSLADSELDNYWSTFDPFEGAAVADSDEQSRLMAGRLTSVKRQLTSFPPPSTAQQQPCSRKRPRHRSTSPTLSGWCGESAEQSPANTYWSLPFSVERQRASPLLTGDLKRPSYEPHLSQVVDGASVNSASSSSSLGIPFGLLSSLPPNCSVYITHRPSTASDQKSPPPITQIIINNGQPPHPLQLPQQPANVVPYCPLPSVPSPQGPRVRTSPATLSQFHPLDDVRLRHPSLACRSSTPLTTGVRPPKCLSTYAAEFRRFGSGMSDSGTWKCEIGRRASDSETANSMSNSASMRNDVADRYRRHSPAFLLPTSPAATCSLASRCANNFEGSTPVLLSPNTELPLVPRQHSREQLFCSPSAEQSQLQPLQTCNVGLEFAMQSRRTPTSRVRHTSADEADETLVRAGVARSSLEDATAAADSNSSGDSFGTDNTTCLDATYHFCSSCSTSPSSLVEGTEPPPSPATTDAAATSAAATVKPRQRTIDALSMKLQRNRRKKTELPTTSVKKETSVTTADSSCPTPPIFRPIASISSSSAFSPPSESNKIPHVSQRSQSCLHGGDGGKINDGNKSTNDLTKDAMLPPRRKRNSRRKKQISPQLPSNGVEKVIMQYNFVDQIPNLCIMQVYSLTKRNRFEIGPIFH